MSFGYVFKSLEDLTTETTKEQKADKLRKDVAAIIKDGCKDQGSLPSCFKRFTDVYNFGRRYILDYPLSTVIYNAAEGVKTGQLRPIYLKHREYCSFRDNRTPIAQPTSDAEGSSNDNSRTGGVDVGGGGNQSTPMIVKTLHLNLLQLLIRCRMQYSKLWRLRKQLLWKWFEDLLMTLALIPIMAFHYILISFLIQISSNHQTRYAQMDEIPNQSTLMKERSPE